MKKKEFVNMLANKAGFTISDTTYFLKGLKEVLEELVEKGETVDVHGIFQLRYKLWPKRKGWNPHTNQYEIWEETKTILFSPSYNLRDVLRAPDKKFCKSNKKYLENNPKEK